MRKGLLICLKKDGEQGAKYPISEGEVCKMGPGLGCQLRFNINQGKGVFCSVSVDEKGLVQLQKLTSCSVLVNNVEIQNTTYLSFGDLIEIEGKKFLWESHLNTDNSLSDNQEKPTCTQGFLSTTQIHGRKSLNEFRASKSSSTIENISGWRESEESVITRKNKQENTQFAVSTSPFHLSYFGTSPSTKKETSSFKIKLKSGTTPSKKTPRKSATRKSTSVNSTSSKKTPVKSTNANKTSVTKNLVSNIPLAVKSTEKKYFEPGSSTEKLSKMPGKYYFTPIKLTPKVTKPKTPKLNIKDLRTRGASTEKIIKQKTPIRKMKTPTITHKPNSVQTSKQTPKSTTATLKGNMETPQSTRKLIKETKPRANEKINTPKSSGKAAHENVKSPKSNAKKNKTAPVVKAPTIKENATRTSFVRATSRSSKQLKKSPTITVKNGKSSVKKIVGQKRKRNSGNDTFERSAKRRNIDFETSIESEKENYVLNSPKIPMISSLTSSQLQIGTHTPKNNIFNPFVYLEKNDFNIIHRNNSRRKVLTQPKVINYNLRRMSAPGRYNDILKFDNSNTSTPKMPTADLILQNIFEKSSRGNITPIVAINVNYNTNINYKNELDELHSCTSSQYDSNLSGIKQLADTSDLISFDSPLIPIRKKRKTRSLQKRVSLLNKSNLTSSVVNLNDSGELFSSLISDVSLRRTKSKNVLNNSNLTSSLIELNNTGELVSSNSNGSNIKLRKSLRNTVNKTDSLINATELNESAVGKQTENDFKTSRELVSSNINNSNTSRRKTLRNILNTNSLLDINVTELNDSNVNKQTKDDLKTSGKLVSSNINSSNASRRKSNIKNDTESLNNVKVAGLNKSVINQPQENDLSNLANVTNFSETPKVTRSPYNDLSDVRGVRKLMRTPKFKETSPKNDLSDVRGVRKLMRTPKFKETSPKNDLSDVRGVRKLMRTPKCKETAPKNDLNDVRGVRKLMRTPKFKETSPKNDLSDVRGVRKLMRTPKCKEIAPKNDLNDVRGVRKLMRTPKFKETSPKNDLSDVRGVRKLMRTPKFKETSPKNDLSDVRGVRKLMRTPKVTETSPKNDLSDVRGVRKLMRTPKFKETSPKNDLSDVRGVRKLMRTPKVKEISSRNDLSDVRGVRRLMETSNLKETSPINDLTDVFGVKQLMTSKWTPKNNLCDVTGVKNLFETPTIKNSPVVNVLPKSFINKRSSKNKLFDIDGGNKLIKTEPPENKLNDVVEVDPQSNAWRTSYSNSQEIKQLEKPMPESRKSENIIARNENSQIKLADKILSDKLSEYNKKCSRTVKRLPAKLIQIAHAFAAENEKKRLKENLAEKREPNSSHNVNDMDVIFNKLKGDDNSSVDEAIQKLMKSTPIRTYERKVKSLSPGKQTSNANNRNSLGTVPRKSADIQKWVEEQKMYLLGKPGSSDIKLFTDGSPVVILNKTHDIMQLKEHLLQDSDITGPNGIKIELDEQKDEDTKLVSKPRVRRKRKIINEDEEISTPQTRSRRAKIDDAKNNVSSEKTTTPRKRVKKQTTVELENDLAINTRKTRRQKQKDEELKEIQNSDSQPIKEEKEDTKRTRRTKKDTAKPLNEERGVIVGDEDTEKGKRKLRGRRTSLDDTKQQEKETPKRSSKRKGEIISNEKENSDDENEPVSKKPKTKNIKISKELTENTEEIPVRKTRGKLKAVDKQNVEKKEPATKKATRGKVKIENVRKEAEEVEVVTKKTTRKQAKVKDLVEDIQKENIIKSNNDKTRKKVIAFEENTNNSSDKTVRTRKANSSTKTTGDKNIEETGTDKNKSRSRRNKAVAQEIVEENAVQVRRSARTRTATK